MAYLNEQNVGGTDYDLHDRRLDEPTNVGQSFNRVVTMKDDGTLGTSSVDDVAQMTAAAATLYFVRVWNLANSTPVAASWEGNLAFGQKMEEYLRLGCYLVKNDHSRRKLGANNHYQYDGGGAARLSGEDGHYQFGWQPITGRGFYILVRQYGDMMALGVSLTFKEGYENYYVPVASDSAAGWATIERSTGRLVSYINSGADYRGGSNDSSRDSAFNTLLGRPASNITTQAFLNAAHLNGDGWLGSSMRFHAVAVMLFYVIFGTLKIDTAWNPNRDANGLRQGGLGTGPVNAGGWWGEKFGYQPVIPMSAGIELGDQCGVFTYDVLDENGNVLQTMNCYSFFGYKNAFGGIMWRMMTDELLRCNSDGSQTHLIAEKIMKVNGAWTYSIADSDSGFREGATGPAAAEGNWGYITRIQAKRLELFVTAVGGDANTRFSDGYYNPAATSGFRFVLRSGDLNNGGVCGPTFVHGGDGVGDAFVSIGSSLCEVSEEWPVDPVDESGQQLANAN